MKKLMIVAAVFTAALVTGCDSITGKWADSEITNDSSFEVTFKFNHTGTMTLAPHSAVPAKFETVIYQYLERYSPGKKVVFSYEATNDGYTGTFSDKPSWDVRVTNTSGFAVILSADGYTASDEISIAVSADGFDAGKIYTDEPKFSARTANGYLLATDFNYIDGDCFVTIH